MSRQTDMAMSTAALRTPTDGICGDGYHPEVLKAIVRAVPLISDCTEVTSPDLAQIDSLDVSGEDVDSLHKRDFEGLTGLLTLDLSGNDLDYLPSNLFDHVTTLTELKLNGNDIAALPANVFNRLTALTELELNGNDITVLPGNVFNQLTSLQALDLRANELTTLPPGVFDRLTELQPAEVFEQQSRHPARQRVRAAHEADIRGVVAPQQPGFRDLCARGHGRRARADGDAGRAGGP